MDSNIHIKFIRVAIYGKKEMRIKNGNTEINIYFKQEESLLQLIIMLDQELKINRHVDDTLDTCKINSIFCS